jgi:hypothetical protein
MGFQKNDEEVDLKNFDFFRKSLAEKGLEQSFVGV